MIKKLKLNIKMKDTDLVSIRINKYILLIIFFCISIFNYYILFSNIYGKNLENDTGSGTDISSSFDVSASKEALYEGAKDEVSKNLNLKDYVSSLNELIEKSEISDFDLDDISESLLDEGKIDFSNITLKILSLFGSEVTNILKGSISIFIVIIIMAIIDSLQLEKNSDVSNIAKLACFLAISVVTIDGFVGVISSLSKVVTVITTAMQIISPFLMAVLIATGAISTTGIIQPLLLFIASSIGFIINYIVIPFMSLSVVFNVISRISEDIKLNKISNMFNKSGIWIIGIVFTVFLGVLSLETSLTTSIDTLTLKTTQAAISNFVPVVGKFFSDSLETVAGATKLISKAGGILGIITVIFISIVPIIKIATIMFVYKILAAVIEPISHDKDMIEYISEFANIYQTILGILIGVLMLFVISIGIVINLSGSVIT